MPSTEVVLTGEMYPIRLGGSGGALARRVQSFSVDKSRSLKRITSSARLGCLA